MSEAKKQVDAATTLDEVNVVAWLQAHPQFLQQHPEVLAEQEISHDSGGAASLIERQVGLLREENRELQSRLDEFVAVARSNEQRVTQLNNLAQALLEACDIGQLMTGLADCVRQQMAVDAVFAGICHTGDIPGDADGAIRPLSGEDACSDAVMEVLRSGQPVCGPLSAAQVQALFEDADPQPASAAMVPLGETQTQGVLVLASTDAEQFTADMGTLFLSLAGDLVTTALRRHAGAAVLP